MTLCWLAYMSSGYTGWQVSEYCYSTQKAVLSLLLAIKLGQERTAGSEQHLQPFKAVYCTSGVGRCAQNQQATARSQRRAQLLRRQHITLVCWAVYEYRASPCQASHFGVAHPVRRWYQNLRGETSYPLPCLHQHSDAHRSRRRVPVHCSLGS